VFALTRTKVDQIWAVGEVNSNDSVLEHAVIYKGDFSSVKRHKAEIGFDTVYVIPLNNGIAAQLRSCDGRRVIVGGEYNPYKRVYTVDTIEKI